MNSAGAICEQEGHHADFEVGWGRVVAKIWTHKIDGLTESDFVLAAKFDLLWKGGMMTSVQDNIISRRSIYRFKESPMISPLETAFEAPRHAPCHKQTHPWNFYVLGEETRISMIPEIERLAKDKAAKVGEDGVQEGIQRAISKILSPPVLIAVTSSVTPGDSFREMEDYAATVCSVQNLVLSSLGSGIGSQWSTGSITRSDLWL